MRHVGNIFCKSLKPENNAAKPLGCSLLQSVRFKRTYAILKITQCPQARFSHLCCSSAPSAACNPRFPWSGADNRFGKGVSLKAGPEFPPSAWTHSHHTAAVPWQDGTSRQWCGLQNDGAFQILSYNGAHNMLRPTIKRQGPYRSHSSRQNQVCVALVTWMNLQG